MTEAMEQATIMDARRVLAASAKESQRISETLARSREIRESAIKVLQRAGYRVS